MSEGKPGGVQYRSFFGPILLIFLGAVFLIHNLGVLPGSGWDTFLKLWPALLVIAGLDDLIRGKGVVWPALLIAGGIFLLLNNFGPRSWISWSQLLQLWPVILIALGIDLIFRSGPAGHTGWSSAVGIFLTLVLVAGAVWWAGAEGYRDRAGRDPFQVGSGAELTSAEVRLSLNAGQLIVGCAPGEEAFAAGTMSDQQAVRSYQTRGNRAEFRLESRDLMIFPGTASWEVAFHEEVPLDMKVSNGAGQLYLAVENLNLNELAVEQGAGEILVRLPEQDGGQFVIQQAVGRIRVLIPPDLGLRVSTERALSTLTLPDDFRRSGEGYQPLDYEEADQQAELVIEQAVGTIDIERLK